MGRISLLSFVVPMAGCVIIVTLFTPQQSGGEAVSPIYGVTIPSGYRQWEFIAPAHEVGLNELRVVAGNGIAIKAYQSGTLPFPDGAILVKLAWKRVPSSEISSAFVPGSVAAIQVMVQNSQRYASTDGWGFGKFIDGKPTPFAQQETCFACHASHVRDHDYVFTRWAP